jgi:phosphatidylglycerophosphatase C
MNEETGDVTSSTNTGPSAALRPSTSDRGHGEADATPVAVWDVDGTLVLGDTLIPFLHRFVGAVQLGRVLLGTLARAATGPDPRDAAKAAALQRILGGLELRTVKVVARGYVLDLVAQRLRADCLRRWRWHQQRGHRLVLASASLDLYLRPLGDLLGADEVISTTMDIVNGRLTGRLATPNCRGTQKAKRVRDYLESRPTSTVWVYANGADDRPTLALADIPVRVRPYRPLPAIAGSEV